MSTNNTNFEGTQYQSNIGLPFAGRYDLVNKVSLDSREVVDTLAGLTSLHTQNIAYDGLVVFCVEDSTYYRYCAGGEEAADGNTYFWKNLAGQFIQQNTAYDSTTETFQFFKKDPNR